MRSPIEISNVTGAIAPDNIIKAEFAAATATDCEAVKAGAAVTAGDAKASGASGLTKIGMDFLSRVVAWPVKNVGYVSFHWSTPDRKKGDNHTFIPAGKPFQDKVAFFSHVEWALTTKSHRDFYFCLSTQSTAKVNNQGKVKAVKQQSNALYVKSIWLDVDVKPDKPEKNYTTQIEAWNAITAFRVAAGLPQFSAVISSGGGFHIYWISDRVLTPDQWRPYAEGLKSLAIKHGLKFDAGLTTDSARVLRVPDTFNYKTDPPKPVKLLHLSSKDHDFANSGLNVLPTLAPATVTAIAPATIHQFFDPRAFPGKKPAKAFDVLPNESLADGIHRDNSDRLDIEPIKRECGFIRGALESGGKNFSQPLWNLTTLCAVFLKDGEKLAHEMARGHSNYSVEETDALWIRKNKEHEQQGLGWPGCKAIQNDGCTGCAACPHISKGKSPLHLALPSAHTADPSQADHRGSSDGKWPNWPDPLDFHQVPVQEAIARVNAAGYFVLTLNGDVYKVEPGGGVTVQKREGFNNLFASRKARLDDGKLISAGDAWKRSPERREYDKIGYWPGGHGCPIKSYNLWQGWGIEPKEGDWKIIHEHILHVLACGDKGKADYILDWCAHLVQRPWEKPGVALVFRGRKGTGKSLLTSLLKAAVGSRNVLVTASGKKLFGTFNWHLADKLLIGAEEAFFVGNHELTDQLKHLLTGDDIEVEQKFGQRLSIKSMHRMIMTSNHDQVIYASDDERRYAVYDVSEARRGDDVYFDPLVAIFKGQDDVTLAAFMHALQTRDINDWKAEQAARKAGGIDLARQKLLSLEPPLHWLLEISRESPFELGDAPEERKRNDMVAGYRAWCKTSQVRGASDFTGDEVFWNCIKRLLNDKIFLGRKLFRSSGGKRFVILPPGQELLDGFNRLLGGKVLDVDEDQIEDERV